MVMHAAKNARRRAKTAARNQNFRSGRLILRSGSLKFRRVCLFSRCGSLKFRRVCLFSRCGSLNFRSGHTKF